MIITKLHGFMLDKDLLIDFNGLWPGSFFTVSLTACFSNITDLANFDFGELNLPKSDAELLRGIAEYFGLLDCAFESDKFLLQQKSLLLSDCLKIRNIVCLKIKSNTHLLGLNFLGENLFRPGLASIGEPS